MHMTIAIIGLAAFVLTFSASTTMAPAPIARVTGFLAHLGFWSRISYAAMLLGLCGTTLTGVVAYLFGATMTGWWLMLHCSAGPLFALGAAGVAVTFAERNVLGERTVFTGIQKVLFWLILVCAVAVLLTAVSPMMPWAGTPGQHKLFLTHRYSSIALVVLTALHAVSIVRSGQQRA